MNFSLFVGQKKTKKGHLVPNFIRLQSKNDTTKSVTLPFQLLQHSLSIQISAPLPLENLVNESTPSTINPTPPPPSPAPSLTSPPISSSTTLLLGQYMFTTEMKKKMTQKSDGNRDPRKKQIIKPNFPESVFVALFPEAIHLRKGWILTLKSSESITAMFGEIERKFSGGEIAKITPPMTITYSSSKRLRILFFYEVWDHQGKLAEWVRMSTLVYDHNILVAK
jgi:hypothetical protein